MGKIEIVEGIRIHFGSNFVKQTEIMDLQSMLMVEINFAFDNELKCEGSLDRVTPAGLSQEYI